MPKLLIGGKQKQRSRIALGHTVAAVFPMRPSFSVGITEEEAKGLPVQLISQPSLQRAEHPSAEVSEDAAAAIQSAGFELRAAAIAVISSSALLEIEKGRRFFRPVKADKTTPKYL